MNTNECQNNNDDVDYQSIAKGKCVILVLLDFANAFGSIDHATLIQILESVGVEDKTLKWYENFLSEWQQTVKSEDGVSHPQTIKRGIIQGENNSQMLFSLFINNLVSYIKFTKIILFADDVQIYVECDVSAIKEGIQIINNELVNVVKYGTDYGIEINPSKTKAVIISSKNNLHKLNYENLDEIFVNGDQIEYANEGRNLGYYLNRTLSSETHIDIVRKKVYGSLNSIRPLKNLLPHEIKLQLIKTLV